MGVWRRDLERDRGGLRRKFGKSRRGPIDRLMRKKDDFFFPFFLVYYNFLKQMTPSFRFIFKFFLFIDSAIALTFKLDFYFSFWVLFLVPNLKLVDWKRTRRMWIRVS